MQMLRAVMSVMIFNPEQSEVNRFQIFGIDTTQFVIYDGYFDLAQMHLRYIWQVIIDVF